MKARAIQTAIDDLDPDERFNAFLLLFAEERAAECELLLRLPDGSVRSDMVRRIRMAQNAILKLLSSFYRCWFIRGQMRTLDFLEEISTKLDGIELNVEAYRKNVSENLEEASRHLRTIYEATIATCQDFGLEPGRVFDLFPDILDGFLHEKMLELIEGVAADPDEVARYQFTIRADFLNAGFRLRRISRTG